MDRSVIESNGVAKLKQVLNSTCRIKALIPEGEKNICWDGEIQLFDSDSLTKAHLYAAIPVQVKTHNVSKFTCKHQIYKEDLINFKKKRNIIFFVVQFLKEDLNKYKIYYKTMLLIDMEKALNAFINEDSKSFVFKELPTNTNEILEIMQRFASDNEHLNHTMDNVTSVADFIKEKGNNHSLNFDLLFPKNSLINDRDVYRELKRQQPYIYYREAVSGLNVSVDKLDFPFVSLKTKSNVLVTIDGEIIFRQIVTETNENSQIIHLGNSLRITNENGKCKLSIEITNNLDERVNAFKFLCALADEKEVFVGKQRFVYSKGFDEEKSKQAHNILNFLCKVKKVLDYFDIEKEIDLSDCDERRAKYLMYIYRCVFDKKPVPIIKPNNGGTFLRVFGLKLLCMVVSNDKNSYICNYFDKRNKLQIRDSNGKVYKETSIYLVLGENDCNPFLMVNNINLNRMIKDIFSYNLGEQELIDTNNVLLNLISYYDAVKDENVLKCAISFSKKMNTLSVDDVYQINYLQCIARKRTLNKKEKAIVNDILFRTSDKTLLCGCYILLGDIIMFHKTFNRLSKRDKESFKGYPIFALLQNINTKGA